MIPFNQSPHIGEEREYIDELLENLYALNGDGKYTNLVSKLIDKNLPSSKVLLTTSCTHALELSALLIDIKPGDEVIAPSYTFVSTVNAFVLRGATIVFVDIDPKTMNIDTSLIEDAITDKTKAIVPVHYAGVACDMDEINDIASKYQLYVIEDAAQGVMASYKGQSLGSIGNLGCYSFHDTKNYSMGEGGALLIQDSSLKNKAEIIREKGTNRSAFIRGQVDKYTWVDVGSSYLPSELNAAYLYPQLQHADMINDDRLKTWGVYYKRLKPLQEEGYIDLPYIPDYAEHNGHMFYIKCKDIDERTQLMSWLKEEGIQTAFHYVPLHSSPAGEKYSRFHGKDYYTTKESERLLRLPMFYGLADSDLQYIVDSIFHFYQSKGN